MDDDLEITSEPMEDFALRQTRAYFRRFPEVRDMFVANGVMTVIETMCQIIALETAQYATTEAAQTFSRIIDTVADPTISDERRAKVANDVKRTVDDMIFGTIATPQDD